MSRLLLVRHAQASFFAKCYDRLSSLGERQARALGQHWSRFAIRPDHVITGPRERQIRTAEIVRAICCENGTNWPAAETQPEFDEHCVDRLLGEPLEALMQHHSMLEPLVAEYRNAAALEQIQRSFQRLFEAACRLWCDGAAGTESIESWNDFSARVHAGIHKIIEHAERGRTVVVFTSVGNITAVLGLALGCSPVRALELGWRLKNCSVTELIFSGSRITLDQFNCVAHLPDSTMWTYR